MSDASTRAPVGLRDLAHEDLGAVMGIERASFTTPWRQSTFESLLRRADTDLIAAVSDDVLVGYAVCWTILDQAELGNVAVAESARRRGVARLLVAAALERARARGAGECFLEVRESNTAAQALYRECGFEVVGRRKRYYSTPTEDALVMRSTV